MWLTKLIRIDTGKYVGSEDDMVIEEDTDQNHQKEEHNLEMDGEGLWLICKTMTVTLEHPKLSVFDLLFMIFKSFYAIYSLILLLQTYRLVWLLFSVKIASIF